MRSKWDFIFCRKHFHTKDNHIWAEFLNHNLFQTKMRALMEKDK